MKQINDMDKSSSETASFDVKIRLPALSCQDQRAFEREVAVLMRTLNAGPPDWSVHTCIRASV